MPICRVEIVPIQMLKHVSNIMNKMRWVVRDRDP